MAEISLKIKSDFEQAAADFKRLGTLSESMQKNIAKLQEQFEKGSIDKFIERNKLAATAITATRGSAAGLEAEYRGLQKEIERLIKGGIDPQSAALQKLKSRYQELEPQISKAQNEIKQGSSIFQKFGATILAVGVAFGAYQISKKIYDIGAASLKAAANMEQQTVAFTTMLGSAEKAKTLLNDIQNFAATTPFQFTELVDASKRLIAFGFDASEVVDTLRMLGDVSSGLGQPIGDMIYLFGQIKTQGRAMTQDLMQFANRGVPIYEELAKVLGVNQAQVKKFAEEGKIGFKEIDQVFRNLTKEGGKFANLMDAQSRTLAGQWSNFNDALEKTAIILGEKLSPMAVMFVQGLTLAIKEFNSGSDPTIQKLNAIVSLMSDAEQQQIFDMARWFKGDVSGNLDRILLYQEQTFGYQGKINAAAALYQEFLMGRVNLTAQQAQQLQKIAGVESQLGKKGGNGNNPTMPTAGSAPKTVAELMQNSMKGLGSTESGVYAERLKVASDFYAKKIELEKVHGEDLIAWQAEQASLIANNDKMTYDQRIAAMAALSDTVKRQSQNDVKNFAKFGGQIASYGSQMFQDLITVMNNAGKSSKAFAIGLKITSAAEAGINSYLAFTQVLRDPTIWPSWLRLPLAATILAAGLAKQAAIISTPISGETGLTNYTVPETRAYRNDGYPVRAQAGEQVTITPRGQEAGGSNTYIFQMGETQFFKYVQRGIDTGKIKLTNRNIGRSVFST